MALKTCHECGKEYSSEAKACIHCGARNESWTSPGMKVAATLFCIVFAGVILVGVLIANRPKEPAGLAKAKSQARAALDECRSRQDDELRELSERRFTRAMCDKMEADFRSNFGENP